MTGNIAELNDPANTSDNYGNYPNAVHWGDDPAEPSIRGRKLYIPIDAWFSLTSKMAFPLISMQYNELQIQIHMRPIKELFNSFNFRSISGLSGLGPIKLISPFITENSCGNSSSN